MKNRFMVIILIFFALNNLYSDVYQELFDDGVSYYEQKDYENAIKSFEKIIEQGRENGELLFNLGNCYFRIGKIGQSILHYEKAKEYLGADRDLIYNLDLAEKYIQNPIIVPPKVFFIRWWNFLLSSLPIDLLGYLLLVTMSVILILSFLILQYRYKNWIPLIQNIRVVLYVCFVLLFLLTGLRIHFLSSNRFAVTLVPKTSLKSEPLQESKDLIFIPEGVKVKVLREIGTWIEIQLPDGNKGWIISDHIGLI